MQDVESRIQKLNEKISNIEITDRKGLISRLEVVEQRMLSLTNLFDRTRMEHKETDSELKGILNTVTKEVEITKETFFHNNGIESLDIHDTLKNMQRKTDNLISTRKEREARILSAIEEHVQKLKDGFQNFENQRSQAFNELMELTEEETNKLSEEMSMAKEELLEQSALLIEKLEQAKNEMMEELTNERKVREKNEGAIYDMLKDVIERLKSDLDKEQIDREKTEETIMMLLDDITNKLKTLAG